MKANPQCPVLHLASNVLAVSPSSDIITALSVWVLTGWMDDTCPNGVCCVNAIAAVTADLAMRSIQSVQVLVATDRIASNLFVLVSAFNVLNKIG